MIGDATVVKRHRALERAAALIVLALILLCCATMAHADPSSSGGLFSVPATDQSKRLILDKLFGGLTGGGSDPLVALLAIFNQAALFLGGIIVAYTLVVGTAMSAHDGEVLGKQWSSFWVPIRTIIGTAFTIPVIKGGYCIAQAIIMWCALQGVGLADTMTVKLVSSMTNYSQTVLPPPPSFAAQSAANDLFVDLVCTNAIADQLDKNADITNDILNGVNDGKVNLIEPTKVYTAKNIGAFIAGQQDINGMYGAAQSNKDAYYAANGYIFYPSQDAAQLGEGACGKIQVLPPVTGGTTNGLMPNGKQTQTGSSNGGSALFNGKAMYAAVYEVQQKNIGSFVNKVNEAAKMFVKDGNSKSKEISKKISEAASDWASATQAAAYSTAKETKNAQIISAIQKEGWLMLGSWYMSIARAQQDLASASALAPQVTAIQVKMEKSKGFWNSVVAFFKPDNNDMIGSDLDGDTKKTIKNAQQLAANSSAQGGVAIAEAGKQDKSGWQAKVSKLFTKYLMIPMSGDNGLNPVITATWLGLRMMYAAAVGLVASLLFAFIPFGGTTIANVTIAISTALLAPGVMLTYYIPLIPFILWIGAAFAWVVMLIEAMVAAPMWMVAHLSPSGEGMMGNARTGYRMLLGLVLRPPLMVVGFAAAVAVMVPLGTLLNAVFFGAFFSAVQPSIIGVLSYIAGAIVYTLVLMDLVKKVFSLIHEVPEHVMGWFDGHSDGRLGQHAQSASQAISGMGSAVATGIGFQAAASAVNQLGADVDRRAAEKRRGKKDESRRKEMDEKTRKEHERGRKMYEKGKAKYERARAVGDIRGMEVGLREMEQGEAVMDKANDVRHANGLDPIPGPHNAGGNIAAADRNLKATKGRIEETKQTLERNVDSATKDLSSARKKENSAASASIVADRDLLQAEQALNEARKTGNESDIRNAKAVYDASNVKAINSRSAHSEATEVRQRAENKLRESKKDLSDYNREHRF